MKILLINNNPVVSRLTALSARKENVEIDEIKNISELKASNYDIIFVDEESYNNDVLNIIRNSGVEKRILFYSQEDENTQSSFTQSILKPFLPSEVSEILRENKLSLLKEKEKKQQEEKESKTAIVFDDLVEEKKEKELKVLNITEKKDKFDEKLEEAFPLEMDALSNDNEPSKSASKDKESEKKYEKDMFELDDDLFELDDKKDTTKDITKDINNIDSDLFELDKEIKKDILEDNAPLDFDLESKEEVDFEAKPKKEIEIPKVEVTKEEVKPEKEPEITPLKEIESDSVTNVLDNTEISKIKDILEEKEGAEHLTMVPSSLMGINSKIEEEKEDKNEKSRKISTKKKNKNKSLETLSTGEAIAHTLNKLPVEDLRKLLRGAKVNVSIEFPNDI